MSTKPATDGDMAVEIECPACDGKRAGLVAAALAFLRCRICHGTGLVWPRVGDGAGEKVRGLDSFLVTAGALAKGASRVRISKCSPEQLEGTELAGNANGPAYSILAETDDEPLCIGGFREAAYSDLKDLAVRFASEGQPSSGARTSTWQLRVTGEAYVARLSVWDNLEVVTVIFEQATSPRPQAPRARA